MCERHSFILTRSGKVYDGYGITDSHTTIREWAGMSVNDDTVNAYEWHPPTGWPDADWHLGLTKDIEVFVTKASHELTIERHLRGLYPSMAEWDNGDSPRGKIPTTVVGWLNMSGCDLSGVTLPTTVGGSIYK